MVLSKRLMSITLGALLVPSMIILERAVEIYYKQFML
jgi:hypothetical protein